MKKLFVIIIGIVLVAGCTKEDKPELPMLFTTDASDITPTSATSGGNIIADGGAPITIRGVVWSTLANPTIGLSTKTNDGTGTSSFTSSVVGLTANTKYYVRAFATNEAGTAYGKEVSFTTLSGVAVLTTITPNAITTTSYTSGGSISSDGGSVITARGVVWGTSMNPTIDLNTKTNNGSGTGSFTSSITELATNTKYFLRAYAINATGKVYYGNEESFVTLVPIILPSVTIGNQIWTDKNLNVSTYSDGTEIPQVTDQNEWNNLTTGAWCYYNNGSKNGEIYGKLYNWYAVAGIWNEASKTDETIRKKLAPAGWHVPTKSEWLVLIDLFGGQSIAGGSLKETGIVHWKSPNSAATNASGLTGLPGGYRSYMIDFGGISFFRAIQEQGLWWSSSYADMYNLAWYIGMNYNYINGPAGPGPSNKKEGYSVRCIKD